MTRVKLKEKYISYLSLLQTFNNISVIMLLRTFNIISPLQDVRRGDYVIHAGGSGVRLNDGPDIKLFILVGWGRSFFVCCLAHRGSTVGFLLLQCSSGVVRHPGDLRVSVATRCFCPRLCFIVVYL